MTKQGQTNSMPSSKKLYAWAEDNNIHPDQSIHDDEQTTTAKQSERSERSVPGRSDD
jgi:hypothetical protein